MLHSKYLNNSRNRTYYTGTGDSYKTLETEAAEFQSLVLIQYQVKKFWDLIKCSTWCAKLLGFYMLLKLEGLNANAACMAQNS